jgi:hypothetical protein
VEPAPQLLPLPPPPAGGCTVRPLLLLPLLWVDVALPPLPEPRALLIPGQVWPAGKLRGELLEMLESFRRRWDPQQIGALAQQLKDFAESLAKK